MTIITTSPSDALITLEQVDAITDAIAARLGNSTYDESGLAKKVDITTYEAGMDTKVDKTVYEANIATKVDTTVYEAGIAQKVDTTVYKAEIAKKLDTDTYKSDIGTKVDKSTYANDMITKVDKVAGKQLSTNDYTDADKSKLNNIATGAQANVLETIKVNGKALEVTDKSVNINLAEYIESVVPTSALLYRGTVAAYSALPTSNQKVGDVYNVTAADASHNLNAGENVVWNGKEWDNLGGITDLSGKVDKVDGKGLSTNDFTDDLKNKLQDVSQNAQANVLETISINGIAIEATDKNVNIDLSEYAKTSDLANIPKDSNTVAIVTLSSDVTATKGTILGYKAGGFVKANNTDYTTLQNVVICLEDSSDSNVKILKQGEFSVEGLSDGSTVFVGTEGKYTTTMPTSSGVYVKAIGTVIGDTIQFHPDSLAIQLA